MKSGRLFALLVAFSAVVASKEVALAQDKVKVRIGTHISISAHLFMQKKPEVLKHMGKSYEVEWVRFAGSGDAMPALVAGMLDGSLATPFPMANALFQSHVPVMVVHQLLSFGFDGYYDDAYGPFYDGFPVHSGADPCLSVRYGSASRPDGIRIAFRTRGCPA